MNSLTMRLNLHPTRRSLRTLLCLPFLTMAFAQSGPTPDPTAIERQILQALAGEWAGYLEYRDYSEPATSTKRVQLPTWLAVSTAEGPVTMRFLYDDGPSKVVEETERISIDAAKSEYRIRTGSGVETTYRVDGIATLRGGVGTLVLSGAGTDNDKPADRRITLTIKRNLIQWLLETRPAGAAGDFAFRHMYRFTRSRPPSMTPPRQ